MKRNKSLIKKVFERDNFTCQKCKIQDKTAKALEVHHIIPITFDGKDEIDNLITLCSDCHHFAPNTKKEFDEYLGEECTGTMTTLLKSFKKVRLEYQEEFKKLENKEKNEKK